MGDAAFVKDDLLRAQRKRRALLGRQAERLIAGVAVQRLRAAEHGRERLDRHANDVVVGLLGARVGGPEPLPHRPGPEPARRAEFRNLFEEAVVRAEEERDPLAELVHVEPGVDRRLDVRAGVRERERHFLHGGRARFADVIAAD